MWLTRGANEFGRRRAHAVDLCEIRLRHETWILDARDHQRRVRERRPWSVGRGGQGVDEIFLHFSAVDLTRSAYPV